jgi:hypothetical protein
MCVFSFHIEFAQHVCYVEDLIRRFLGQQITADEKQCESLEQAFNHFNISFINPEIICRKNSYSRQNQPEHSIPLSSNRRKSKPKFCSSC